MLGEIRCRLEAEHESVAAIELWLANRLATSVTPSDSGRMHDIQHGWE
jgi:hypothetical protein